MQNSLRPRGRRGRRRCTHVVLEKEQGSCKLRHPAHLALNFQTAPVVRKESSFLERFFSLLLRLFLLSLKKRFERSCEQKKLAISFLPTRSAGVYWCDLFANFRPALSCGEMPHSPWIHQRALSRDDPSCLWPCRRERLLSH